MVMFYLDLFARLTQSHVRYVVVGGLALNLHGVERATMDVDLAVALDAGNLRAAIDVFRSMSLVPIAPIDLDDASDPAMLAHWRQDRHMIALGLRPAVGHGPTVDVLTATFVPFETLEANAVRKRLGDADVPIASIDDLIALKRAAGRPIDLSDIDALETLRRLGLDK
ncbi:MAG: hypothetical protein ACREBP_05310 [Sphingomicrobium sp.]